MEHCENGPLCVPFNLTVHLIIPFFSFVCSFLKEIVPIQLTSLSFRSHTVGKIVPHKQSLPQPLAVLHMHHIVPSSSFPIV